MRTTDLKVKICGMRDIENILQVSALAPDYLGFIFYNKSPRYVGDDVIIPEGLPENIKRVGVFVNHKYDAVLEMVHKQKLDYVQLHGDESEEYCMQLKEQQVGIIKVFRVDDEFDFSTTTTFEKIADYFLFDTKGKLYGGNSQTFNWTILDKYNQSVPFFLSGGLKLSELSKLKDTSSWNLHAIDVNSGVEDSPGVKNILKVKEMLNTVRI